MGCHAASSRHQEPAGTLAGAFASCTSDPDFTQTPCSLLVTALSQPPPRRNQHPLPSLICNHSRSQSSTRPTTHPAPRTRPTPIPSYPPPSSPHAICVPRPHRLLSQSVSQSVSLGFGQPLPQPTPSNHPRRRPLPVSDLAHLPPVPSLSRNRPVQPHRRVGPTASAIWMTATLASVSRVLDARGARAL